MSSVVISGDTSGAITLSAPAVAGTNTITLPAATGTVQVSGNQPAFSAYQSVAQTPAASTFVLVQLQTESFDTASCFNNTNATVGSIPAYAFLPNVAGYYQINGTIFTNGTVTRLIVSFYKNGAEYTRFFDASNSLAGTGTELLYLNGTTDYVQLYIYNSSGVTPLNAVPATTVFSGSLVRAA